MKPLVPVSAGARVVLGAGFFVIFVALWALATLGTRTVAANAASNNLRMGNSFRHFRALKRVSQEPVS